MILHDIHAEGMILSETFQVVAIIEKLPPTWKDFVSPRNSNFWKNGKIVILITKL